MTLLGDFGGGFEGDFPGEIAALDVVSSWDAFSGGFEDDVPCVAVTVWEEFCGDFEGGDPLVGVASFAEFEPD